MFINKVARKISSLLLVLAVLFALSPACLQAEVFEISINDHNPKGTPPSMAVENWAKTLEDLSGGKIKTTIHQDGTLLKGDQVFNGVKTGVVEAGQYILDPKDGFVLNSVMSLPFMGWPSQEKTGDIYRALLKKFPEMVAEWGNLKVVSIMMMPPEHIHTKGKVVKVPEDLKDMVIQVGQVKEWLEVTGAIMTQTDVAQVGMLMENEIINGVFNHFPVLAAFGNLDKFSNHTLFGEGGISMNQTMLIMNAEKYNSLPADVRKAVDESGPAFHDFFLQRDIGFQVKCLEDAKNMGHTITTLSPDEIKVWYNLIKEPVHDKWIKQAEDKGLPGKALYEEALRLINEASSAQ